MDGRNVSVWQKTTLPAKDDLEVSVLGPGFGEAIVIHFGDGQWATIDSCVDSDGKCAPLEYFKSIGVSADQVKFVIATHWHDDHIRGMPSLLRWARLAAFWCPSVFASPDFLDFAAAYAEEDISALGAPCSDLAEIFDILQDRNALPKFAQQDTVIFSDSTTAVQIFALSPLQSRTHQFLTLIASLVPSLKQPRIRVADLHPNLVSLVVRLVIGPDAAIFGADLQERPHNGWTELLNTSQCISGSKASLFKIPHHGSQNAHLDRQWTQMLSACARRSKATRVSG
jgi:hypothetical protein